MELLHAEVQSRVRLSLQTRGKDPPYEIDGGTFDDPRYVTVRLRTETAAIAKVASAVYYSGNGTEYLKHALRLCSTALARFANRLDGLGGFPLRSDYLGERQEAAVWLEEMSTLITVTLVEIEFLAVDRQEHDTLPPPGPESGKE